MHKLRAEQIDSNALLTEIQTIRPHAKRCEERTVRSLAEVADTAEPFVTALEELNRLPEIPEGMSDDDAEPYYEARANIYDPMWMACLDRLKMSGVIQASAIARRAVTGFAETSTMRGRPVRSTWLRRRRSKRGTGPRGGFGSVTRRG
mgnify:CR=1 FL=1